MQKLKALIPILVPLFISAFRIAQDLAMAMEARCYGGNIKRTRMNGMKFGSRDVAASIMLVAFMAILIAQKIIM
jgi:energy-coupling factor transport system permease protein